MDAVLPICAKDIERAKLLVRSLASHAQDVRTLWVITPPTDVRVAQERLGRAPAPFRMRVLPETEVVPELRVFRIRGWEAQQLVKLAMADRVDSDFYLTLDADVICTRPVALDRIIRDGRAPAVAVERPVDAPARSPPSGRGRCPEMLAGA